MFAAPAWADSVATGAAVVDGAVGEAAQAYDEELKSCLKGLAFVVHMDLR